MNSLFEPHLRQQMQINTKKQIERSFLKEIRLGDFYYFFLLCPKKGQKTAWQKIIFGH
jgi:hypothetical protein